MISLHPGVPIQNVFMETAKFLHHSSQKSTDHSMPRDAAPETGYVNSDICNPLISNKKP